MATIEKPLDFGADRDARLSDTRLASIAAALSLHPDFLNGIESAIVSARERSGLWSLTGAIKP